MSWNYRIVQDINNEDQQNLFAIREIYYDETGKPNGMGDASIINYETRDDLLKSLLLMISALTKPTILWNELNNTLSEEKEVETT